MSLVKAIINSKYKENFLYQLANLNTVHIKPKTGISLKEYLAQERNFTDKVKNLRENLNALFRKLKLSEADFQDLRFKKNERVEMSVKDLNDLLNQTSEEINFFYNRVIELERYISRAKIELENIETIKLSYLFLSQINLNRESLTNFDQLTFKVYTTFSKNLETLKKVFEFNQFPNFYQISYISEDRLVFYIIYPKDKEEDFKERISMIYGEEVPILKKYLTSEGINFDRINREFDLIKTTLNKYEKELERLRNDNLLKFAAISEVVQNIEEYKWAEQQFEELPSSRLYLEFFTPKSKKQSVIDQLQDLFKENIILESLEIKKSEDSKIKKEESATIPKKIMKKSSTDEEVVEPEEETIEKEEKDLRSDTPTIMHNFILFRPFETLTKMYGTPSYSEVDPTPFLAITFPILFGLMFGDIGHGICLIIAGLSGALFFRKKKGTDFRNICWIIFYCGWGAILGGFLYGEFFGMNTIPFLEIELTPIEIAGYTLSQPLENIMTAFAFAIFVGIIHINMGWIIQALNYVKQKRKYLAISDSLCKILFLDGGVFLVLFFGLDLNSWFLYPYPILLPLIPALFLIVSKVLGRFLGISYLKKESLGELIGEGSMETFETMLSVLSNVASYIRILALALIHIALMISIEAMIGIVPTEGIIFQILIVIGLIFGNIIVILLEGLLVFLNDLRLHFYEFFSKFYQGGGIDFFPFYLDSDFSVINFEITGEKDIISEEIEKEVETKTKEDIDKAISYISRKYLSKR